MGGWAKVVWIMFAFGPVVNRRKTQENSISFTLSK
jgi:hypothetical protein